MQERALRREEGAGAPPAAGALGQAEGASADSRASSWGLHTGRLLRPSTRLSGWPLSPKHSLAQDPSLKSPLPILCTQLK